MTSHDNDDFPLSARRDDDPLAARLRAALTSEADMVNPSDDGLQRIRGGVDTAHRPWWRHPAAPALAAAAVLGLMAGGFAVALSGDGEDGNVVAGSSPDPTTTSQSPTTPDEPTASASPVPVEGDVYVYYTRDDDGSLRLYREVRPGIGAEPAPAGLLKMLGEPAEDPDYSSVWPEGTEVVDYSVSGDVATVDLSAFVKVGSEAESVAVQQLVYTVTANDPDVLQVRLLVDGEAPDSGHADWSEPVGRAPMVDVQGLVWLLGPTQDATVSSPVEITGYGTAFEGTISWEVRQDGAMVADGFTEGGANGEFDEFGDTVDLDPGRYEIRAFEGSAEDGSPRHVDTKAFTVE